ncbi:MAG: NAD(+) synthase, partial [Candidatus Aenigmatarchaeota archaeon]
DPDWAEKIIETVGTNRIIAYTRNPWTKQCFGKSGMEVAKNELYFGISSTAVRRRIREGGRWESLVPPFVAKWLLANKGLERVEYLAIPPEKRIVSFIRQKVREAKAGGCIVGVSGGVDSSVMAILAKRALGKKARFFYMPANGRRSENIGLLRNFLEIEEISLKGIYWEFLKNLPDADRVAKGNLQSRLRMAALYYFANREKLIVVGTTNRTELELGYFTKYGDGGVDIEPLAGFYKTEIFALAKRLKIPDGIIESPPTAGLWEGQTDEGELGLTYFQIDLILKLKAQGFEKKDISALTNIPPPKINLIYGRIRDNRHKLETPPFCKARPNDF